MIFEKSKVRGLVEVVIFIVFCFWTIMMLGNLMENLMVIEKPQGDFLIVPENSNQWKIK